MTGTTLATSDSWFQIKDSTVFGNESSFFTEVELGVSLSL